MEFNNLIPKSSKKIDGNFTFESKPTFIAEKKSKNLSKVLFVTTYPPRECGIASYTQDLISALKKQFVNSFKIQICAIENNNEQYTYSGKVKFKLNTSDKNSYRALEQEINSDSSIKAIIIQHEFGLFAETKTDFESFIKKINKPVILVFHTVLPNPAPELKKHVSELIKNTNEIIVMTHHAAMTLSTQYDLHNTPINVIPHGTHLVAHHDKNELKEKYKLKGRKVLSTFGFLGPNKSIKTSLDALPTIIKTTPNIIFLILGKTHPALLLKEGEKYRKSLEHKIETLNLHKHVRFIDKYLPLQELLEYLQLTDVYLFTSIDPNQAVSGTFAYALSAGCPVVSTPIPHAKEFLTDNSGIIIDFNHPDQLSDAVNLLLFDVQYRNHIIHNGLTKTAPTTWENSANSHIKILSKYIIGESKLQYRNPEINLDHIIKMTTDFGIIQFSKINKPDINSGYTIDDNARALLFFCKHYYLTKEINDLKYIEIYLNFIAYCERRQDLFINYVGINHNYTTQNKEVNLEDSTGRTIWALGYLLSHNDILPRELMIKAKEIFERNINKSIEIHSPRALAFIIKGLYYYNLNFGSEYNIRLTQLLSARLASIYQKVATPDWNWFEDYLTYANSALPEAMLYSYWITKNENHKHIAKESMDFLMNLIFKNNQIRVISNKSWYHKNSVPQQYGEQPIDVAYTILALKNFYIEFKNQEYIEKMETAFGWFLGNNHLDLMIYNPCTGGCHDGIEKQNINLNQGAESTISYLLARITVHKHFGNEINLVNRKKNTVSELSKQKF